jgi:hypothetical protein
MSNILHRDRGAKIITQWVESDQTTASTASLPIVFNSPYVRGLLNEPYAVEACLLMDQVGTTHDATLTWDAGGGQLALDGTIVTAATAATTTIAGGNAVLTTSAVVMEVDTSLVVGASGFSVHIKGIWIPSLRDSVTLAVASAGADTYTVRKGSWVKYTRLTD